jgi:hypothetical protein
VRRQLTRIDSRRDVPIEMNLSSIRGRRQTQPSVDALGKHGGQASTDEGVVTARDEDWNARLRVDGIKLAAELDPQQAAHQHPAGNGVAFSWSPEPLADERVADTPDDRRRGRGCMFPSASSGGRNQAAQASDRQAPRATRAPMNASRSAQRHAPTV